MARLQRCWAGTAPRSTARSRATSTTVRCGIAGTTQSAVTFDRGFKFLAYRMLPAPAYFCNPQSPWQKGAVENANGRLRRHLPLDSAPEQRSAGPLSPLAHQLNSTPRKCLGYRTPAEVFAAQLETLSRNRLPHPSPVALQRDSSLLDRAKEQGLVREAEPACGGVVSSARWVFQLYPD